MSGYAERATTRRRQAGFTLIEVMVAIMLMAIVSLMAWRGLDSIARASAHLEDSTEQGAALLRALNQLERDIALHSAIREETETSIRSCTAPRASRRKQCSGAASANSLSGGSRQRQAAFMSPPSSSSPPCFHRPCAAPGLAGAPLAGRAEHRR